jgi:hypothetical protein
MEKQIFGTYWVSWESDLDWESGLWMIYMFTDDPDTLVLQHEDADDEWGMVFILPERRNILLAEGPVAAALHYYYTHKGFRAHSAAYAKWWLRGARETAAHAVRVSGKAVAYWTVDYVTPFVISMLGLVGFFVSSFGMFGNPEFFIFYVALFGASIWALLNWPDWLTDFLATLFGWTVIAGAAIYFGLGLQSLWQSL